MSHITPEGPKIPQIPAVQGRRKFIEISSEYQVPIKCIHSSSHLESFQKSEAYLRILDFLQTLNESIQYKKLSDPCHESDVVHRILSLLNTLDGYITEFPPEESGQRFGNVSFRKWCLKLESVVLINQESLSLHQLLLNDHPAIKELIPYLQGAFGDKTRIDYGSGHELSFIGWLCCLELLNVFDPNDTQALVTRIFARYLELVRKLQRVYNLEPAGSHGVWGLDDYQFLPYFWGSSQLLNHSKIKPKSITDRDLVQYLAKEYLYLACIDYIHQHKRGPFHEHSPMLHDISGVISWSKVNSGMLKMYIAEVLNKFPVIQHFQFGSLLPFTEAQVIK